MNSELQAKNRKILIRGSVFVCAMFAFGFAMVPLYEVFCDITGLNGKVRVGEQLVDQQPDLSRDIKIQFVASNNAGMPWEFRPLESSLNIHPGGQYQVSFYARNSTGQDMVSQSVPSVSPAEASLYLEKIECFCFRNQELAAGEAREMPVVFYFRKDLPEHIETITMAWTLFDITDGSSGVPAMNHGNMSHGGMDQASMNHENMEHSGMNH